MCPTREQDVRLQGLSSAHPRRPGREEWSPFTFGCIPDPPILGRLPNFQQLPTHAAHIVHIRFWYTGRTAQV